MNTSSSRLMRNDIVANDTGIGCWFVDLPQLSSMQGLKSFSLFVSRRDRGVKLEKQKKKT